MGRSDRLFWAKDVVIGLAWYAVSISVLFAVGFLLSWVVKH